MVSRSASAGAAGGKANRNINRYAKIMIMKRKWVIFQVFKLCQVGNGSIRPGRYENEWTARRTARYQCESFKSGRRYHFRPYDNGKPNSNVVIEYCNAKSAGTPVRAGFVPAIRAVSRDSELCSPLSCPFFHEIQ